MENPNKNIVEMGHNVPFKMFPWFITLFLLAGGASQLHVSNAQELTVAVWKGGVLPFPNTPGDDPSEWSGINVDLVNKICPELGGCTILPVDSLKERLSVLEPGGPANFSVGIAVTPEREALVNFIKPYYYSTGATLYSTSASAEDIMAASGWDGLAGKSICILPGYYFLGTLVDKYSAVPLTVATAVEGTDKVLSGECLAYVYGSGYSLQQGLLPVPDLVPQEVRPFGIAVGKTASPELVSSLSAAIIRGMQNGPESTMIELEQQYGGYLPVNTDLANTVDAISTFDTGVLVTTPLSLLLSPPK